MYDVFISYRRDYGFTFAQIIYDRLKEKGIHCFMDMDLKSGKFSPKLKKNIENCKNFVLILTQNSFDRCIDEQDWLRIEIETALSYGKTIIPVLCNDFVWPKKWDENIPKSIQNLEEYNAIFFSQHYLNATIDKLLSYLNNVTYHQIEKCMDTLDFFRSILNKKMSIERIDCCFSMGNQWLEDMNKIDILEELINRGISLRILINSVEAAEFVGKHRRHQNKHYVSFEETIRIWKNFASQHPDYVQVKVTDMVLMHVFYGIQSDDPCALVVYYTNNNARVNKNYSKVFDTKDSFYLKQYFDEFEYMWNYQ